MFFYLFRALARISISFARIALAGVAVIFVPLITLVGLINFAALFVVAVVARLFHLGLTRISGLDCLALFLDPDLPILTGRLPRLYPHGPGFAMDLPVSGHINILVPVIIHKENRLTAGLVTVAVLGPFLGMTGRHAQIGRRWWSCNAVNNNRVGIDQPG